MDKPKAPIEPNYEQIIQNSLNTFNANNKIAQNKIISAANSTNFYMNPAYNEAIVEAFEASVQPKIKSAYYQYIRELDEYHEQLEIYKGTLAEEKNNLEEKTKLLRIDFDTAKMFYDNFQSLVKSKYNFISNYIKSALAKGKEKSDNDEDE